MTLSHDWRTLSEAEFEANASAYDALVLQTPGVDLFCSTSMWTLPAYRAFLEQPEPIFYWHPTGAASFVTQDSPYWGRMLVPLEASWCLACPLVTPAPSFFAPAFAELMQSMTDWDCLFIAGVPEGGALWNSLLHAFQGYQAYRAHPSLRCQASLAQGLDGFLARRSRKFRKNLRRSQRLATRVGLKVIKKADWDTHNVATFIQQAMTCEEKSWKGVAGEGVNQGSMRCFYENMMPRLAARGCLRTVIAELNGQVVGYAFGGVWGDVFRGLQFSYLPEYQQLSLGNLMQVALIEELCGEGIGTYDLGMDMPYKHRWMDQHVTTHALIIKK